MKMIIFAILMACCLLTSGCAPLIDTGWDCQYACFNRDNVKECLSYNEYLQKTGQKDLRY
jgi:predicted small secreted protein